VEKIAEGYYDPDSVTPNRIQLSLLMMREARVKIQLTLQQPPPGVHLASQTNS
jgi:hypothetical protein